jgi:hypothetical protein
MTCLDVEAEVARRAARPRSNIGEHLLTLQAYARQCESVVEFGVEGANSTWALLSGFPKKLTSYDINPEIKKSSAVAVEAAAKAVGVDFKFIVGDSAEVEIEPADMLFIDSYHSYEHLTKELTKHSPKIRKFITMHDTTTFGVVGQGSTKTLKVAGLWPAVEEFVALGVWRVRERLVHCCGLTTLERVSP